eukprot:1190247-Prorocentrum_minimum.AAC.2
MGNREEYLGSPPFDLLVAVVRGALLVSHVTRRSMHSIKSAYASMHRFGYSTTSCDTASRHREARTYSSTSAP